MWWIIQCHKTIIVQIRRQRNTWGKIIGKNVCNCLSLKMFIILFESINTVDYDSHCCRLEAENHKSPGWIEKATFKSSWSKCWHPTVFFKYRLHHRQFGPDSHKKWHISKKINQAASTRSHCTLTVYLVILAVWNFGSFGPKTGVYWNYGTHIKQLALPRVWAKITSLLTIILLPKMTKCLSLHWACILVQIWLKVTLYQKSPVLFKLRIKTLG